jgi:hypothetical protein
MKKMFTNQDEDAILVTERFKPVNQKEFAPVRHERLPQHPFRMGLVGSSGCGKSSVLMSLLFKQYKSYFEKIYVLCPTFHTDDLYSILHDKLPDDQVCDLIAEAENFFEGILEQQQDPDNNKTQKVLIIVDDFGASTKKLGFLNQLAKLRHSNCSILLSVQKMSWLSPPVRNNLTDVLLFSPSSQYENNQVAKEFTWRLSEKEFKALWKEVTKKKGDFLRIDLRSGDCTTHYSHCFDKRITVD